MLPASEVRSRFSSVIGELRRGGGACYITRNGKAVAAVISVEALEGLLSDLEDRLDERDRALSREVAEARRQCRRGKSTSLREIR